MSDFPKYQISKFLDQKRDYQVVVRSDDFEDLMEAMGKMKPWIKQMEEPHRVDKEDVYDKAMDRQTCRKCKKAKMVKNPETGKWFCEDKCWLK